MQFSNMGGTLAWSMLKFTISEIIGANVDEQSFNNIVGTGSNGHDLGGNLRRRDWTSSVSVGFRISREAEVRDSCDDSSGQRLSLMESETFNFQKGVFQGDPLSPVIFLACFNPLLEYLTSIKTKHGYNLNGDKVISTPYADDFNLISNNKRNHQKIISQLNSHCQSMGLSLKPVKCRSLSICSGTPTDIPFHIGNTEIESLKVGPHTFLGSQIFFSGKSTEVFDHVRNEISSKIRNIDQLLVRPEYKVSI